MGKKYELKSDYVGSQDNAAQQKLLEVSPIIEDAPYFLVEERNPILAGCKSRQGGGGKCKGGSGGGGTSCRANSNIKPQTLEDKV